MTTKQKWRLIRDEIMDPMMHFAYEEALLRQSDETEGLPILRIRQTEPSVWIGYYQNPEEDVNLEFCRNNNLRIVRRLNSGGAVYQDYGTFCYSMFFKKSKFLKESGLKDTGELYELFGNIIIELFNKYGIKAELSPMNDITVNKKKIYGSAQMDWYSAFAHSGSILVNADLEKMQAALKPSFLKFADKVSGSIRERVINLSELSDVSDIKKVKEDLIKTFAENLNIQLVETGFTKAENDLANELYINKYSRPDWTYNRNEQHSVVLSTKIDSGVIIMKCSVLGDKIRTVNISGDFLNPDHNKIKKLLSDMVNQTFEGSIDIIQQTEIPDDIKNGLINMINQLMQERL